jgi:hypothetical protein
MLKRLRGTPIVRHDAEWGMVYSPSAPYEVLQTKQIDFAMMQRLRRFARYWDLVANSGNFVETAPLLWAAHGSPFWSFLKLSDCLFERIGRNHGIALHHLAEFLFRHLIDEAGREPGEVATALWRDYRRGGRSDCPEFLRDFVPESERRSLRRDAFEDRVPRRQARHLIRPERSES